jgi:hypothetical protein
VIERRWTTAGRCGASSRRRCRRRADALVPVVVRGYDAEAVAGVAVRVRRISRWRSSFIPARWTTTEESEGH